MVRGFVGLTFDVPDKLAASLTNGASLPEPKAARVVASPGIIPSPAGVLAKANIVAPTKVFVAGK